MLLHKLTALFVCCAIFPATTEAAIISGLSPKGLLSSPPVRAKVEEARGLFKKGDGQGAQKVLDALVRDTPGLPPARLILAKLCLEDGLVRDARLLLEQAAAVSKREPDIYFMLGHFALQDGRLSEAELDYLHAQQLLEQVGWKGERAAEARDLCELGLATVAEGREDWDAAEKHLRAFGSHSSDPAIRQRLARVVFKSGRPKDAEAVLRIESRDEDADASCILMARLWLDNQDAAEAEKWLKKSVALSPSSTRGRIAYISLLLDLGRVDDASQQLALLTKVAPELQETWFLTGLVAWRQHDFAACEHAMERVHRESPANFDATNYLALALSEQRDPAKSRRALELAEVNVRQNPQSAVAYATLGCVLCVQAHTADAVRAFRTAASSGQLSSDTAYYFGKALKAEGEREAARELFASAIKTQGVFTFRAECEAELAKLPAPQAKP